LVGDADGIVIAPNEVAERLVEETAELMVLEKEQELAIAASLRLTDLSFSTPLLLDDNGSPRLYRLSDIGDPARTFSLHLGLGADLIAEGVVPQPFSALPAPQLEGGVTLDLSETDLLALAGAALS
jgi:hypothetical protein